MNMSRLTAVKTSSIAEKFAQNWKEHRGNETEDSQDELDDSLTNLQWLHNITVLDITPAGLATESSPSSSPRSSEDDLAETSSEKSDPEVIKQDSKIDYTSDPNRKPPYSYATLICMAMRETKKTKITLSAIYKWIRENFVYYRHADPTWQVLYLCVFYLYCIFIQVRYPGMCAYFALESIRFYSPPHRYACMSRLGESQVSVRN